MYIRVVKLWPPKHPANEDSVLRQWTDEGLAFYEEHKNDDPPVELTPGLHWKVIEPEVNLRRRDYITYPQKQLLSSFRHEWIMVLQARPFVPQSSGAPMLEKRHTIEERCRILSVYLRPWVLLKCDDSPNVPHLTELNTVRNWNEELNEMDRKFKLCKKTPHVPKSCSYREALYVVVMGISHVTYSN